MRGLYVVVWGSALDDGLVDPVRISLSRLLSPEPVRTGIYTAGDSEITELMLESGESTAGPIRFVVIEDFELPAGPVRPPPVMPTLDALGRVEYTPALRDSILESQRLDPFESVATVYAGVYGIARKPGVGELHIGFAPLQNPEEGRTGATTEIRVE